MSPLHLHIPSAQSQLVELNPVFLVLYMVQPLLELHLGIYDLGVHPFSNGLRLVWMSSLLIYLLVCQ